MSPVEIYHHPLLHLCKAERKKYFIFLVKFLKNLLQWKNKTRTLIGEVNRRNTHLDTAKHANPNTEDRSCLALIYTHFGLFLKI